MRVPVWIFLVIILLVVVLLGLSWLVQGNEFFLYRYFAPKRAAVEREVFENTKSYKECMAQEVRAVQLDYLKADENHKQALRSFILHKVADYDINNLPVDLQEFIRQLRYEAGRPDLMLRFPATSSNR